MRRRRKTGFLLWAVFSVVVAGYVSGGHDLRAGVVVVGIGLLGLGMLILALMC